MSVDGAVVSEIGPGLLVLLGVGREDSEPDADWLAGHIVVRASGDRRSSQGRRRNVIPRSATDDNVLNAAVELITRDDTRQQVETGGSLLFTDAECHCDVIARMAHLPRANIGVIQVQLADQNPIEHHRAGDRHPVPRSDDRALTIAADAFKGMQGALKGVLSTCRQRAADGIQNEKLCV